MWPFNNEKLKIHKTEWESNPRTITLDSNDTPQERAIKIVQCMGLALNKTAVDMLPSMEQALAFYQKHDRLYRKKKVTKVGEQ